MKQKKLNTVVSYALSALALLVVASTVLVSFVFAKYSDVHETNFNVNVQAYGGNIELALTKGIVADAPWENAEHTFLALPGKAYTDFEPHVHLTVEDNAREIYLFVQITEKGGELDMNGVAYTCADFLDYTVADGWTRGVGTDVPENVYYRKLDGSETDRNSFYQIFKDNTVTVNSELPEAAFDAIEAGNEPTLVIGAYAIEITLLEDEISVNNATVKGAWEYISKVGQPPEVDMPDVDLGGEITQ